MGLFDDFEPEDEAPEEGDAAAEPSLPGYHQARSSRAIVVPETRITASPDGGGSIRGGLGTTAEPTSRDVRVEEDAELPDIFEKDAPAAPPSESEYRDAVRAREDEADGGGVTSPDASWLEDVVMSGAGRLPAQRRLGRRVERAAEEATEDPEALLFGAASVPTFNLLDSLSGVGAAVSQLGSVSGMPGSLDDYGPDPMDAASAAYEGVHQADAEAHDRSPYAYGGGEAMGAIASLPLAAEEAGAEGGAQAANWITRLGDGIRTGAEYGGLAGAGASEGSGDELLLDTAEGAALGGLGGAVVAGGGEAVRGLGAAGRNIASRADLQRVASVGGGVSSPLGSRAVDRFRRLPGGIEGQAARLRRLGLVGPTSTQTDIARATSEAVERLGEGGTGAMGATRRRLAEEGHRVPVTAVTEPLEEYASTLEQRAERAPRAPAVRGRAQRYRDAHSGGAPRIGPVSEGTGEVPYQTLREELTDMSRDVPWTATGLDADVARGEREALRGGLDDWIEQTLGPDELRTYQEGRLDFQTALNADEVAREAMDRGARASPLSLTDIMAMQGAESPTQAAMRYAGRRLIGAYGGAGRAAGAELVQQLMQSGAVQRLGQYGPILQRAMQRGGPALAATHYTLSQTDPEYRGLVAELEADGGEDGEAPLPTLFDDFQPDEDEEGAATPAR